MKLNNARKVSSPLENDPVESQGFKRESGSRLKSFRSNLKVFLKVSGLALQDSRVAGEVSSLLGTSLCSEGVNFSSHMVKLHKMSLRYRHCVVHMYNSRITGRAMSSEAN